MHAGIQMFGQLILHDWSSAAVFDGWSHVCGFAGHIFSCNFTHLVALQIPTRTHPDETQELPRKHPHGINNGAPQLHVPSCKLSFGSGGAGGRFVHLSVYLILYVCMHACMCINFSGSHNSNSNDDKAGRVGKRQRQQQQQQQQQHQQ